MTVLVAVLAAVLALGLSAVAVCCVLVCMRRRNKQGGGVFVNPAKSAAYDVEIGELERFEKVE